MRCIKRLLVGLSTCILMTNASLSLAAAEASTSSTKRGLIKIAVSQQGDPKLQKPKSGASMQSVIHTFGSPLSRQNAVGTPPISRWSYKNFVVYFEHEHVVHSVTLHQ